jgi:hypothetical protein
MNWHRVGWIALWAALHAAAKILVAAADAVKLHAFPEPEEDDEEDE